MDKKIKRAVEAAVREVKDELALDTRAAAGSAGHTAPSGQPIVNLGRMRWVTNPWSGVSHRVRPAEFGGDDSSTLCGWRFSELEDVEIRDADLGPKCPVLACGRCAPDIRGSALIE